MNRATPPNQLQALRKILIAEETDGFRDRKVAGGLDRFLQNLLPNARELSSLQILRDLGLLSVGYRELDIGQRKRWALEVQHCIGMDNPLDQQSGDAASLRNQIGLDTPVPILKSVNKATGSRFQTLGVHVMRDLLWFFPNRHLDYSNHSLISQAPVGKDITIIARLREVRELVMGRNRRTRATEAIVEDETGTIRIVWFNQPWVVQNLRRSISGRPEHGNSELQLSISGKISIFNGRKQMNSPEWEAVEDTETDEFLSTGRLLPVYPTTEGLRQKTARRVVREGLLSLRSGSLKIDDPLPRKMLSRLKLCDLTYAINQAHYPDTSETFEVARQRLAFDEFLLLQLALSSKRDSSAGNQVGIPLSPKPAAVMNFIASLPFELTVGQVAAIEDATRDVQKGERPMMRLLQGDVGSGKTVVAMAMLLTSVGSGYQGALMAPTEVLAEQHFLGIRKLLGHLIEPTLEQDWFTVYLDPSNKPITIGLLTGSTKTAARRDIIRRAGEGTIDILVGTHALIQKDVTMTKLAMAIVDEQHRFGVVQRNALRSTSLRTPHILLMSATPIPRTLARTVYGDLDTSNIPDPPAGRPPIKTRIEPWSRHDIVEQFIIEEVAKGRQAFIVCPLIDESEAVLARAATAEYERLRETSFAGLRVGLLHGRMPLGDKQIVMDEFRHGDLEVLVATPVIEVGIDVPNATVMVIQGANRFGLAQLHQLRGRVGRGSHQSSCYLITESASNDAISRLKELVKTNDGFQIAEADLRLRGPGDYFGTRQSGLPTLKMARLDDRPLLELARTEARSLISNDPEMESHVQLAAAVHRYTSTIYDEMA